MPIAQPIFTTQVNYLQWRLLETTRVVGPLVIAVPLHLYSFAGVLFSDNRIMFTLRDSVYPVTAYLGLDRNELNLVFVQDDRLYLQILQLDQSLQIESVVENEVRPSPCLEGQARVIGRLYKLIVMVSSKAICVCQKNLLCFLLLSSAGRLFEAQMLEESVLALEQLGDRVNLILLPLDHPLTNISLGAFPNMSVLIDIEGQRLYTYNSSLLLYYRVNFYSREGQLALLGQLPLAPGCVPSIRQTVLLVCEGRVQVEEYRIDIGGIVLYRVVPLYGFTVQQLAGQAGRFVLLQVVYPNGQEGGFLVLDPSYETVSVMRVSVLGEPPFFLDEHSGQLVLAYQFLGQLNILLYNRAPVIVAYQSKKNIQLELDLSISIALFSSYNFNYYLSQSIIFNLT